MAYVVHLSGTRQTACAMYTDEMERRGCALETWPVAPIVADDGATIRISVWHIPGTLED